MKINWKKSLRAAGLVALALLLLSLICDLLLNLLFPYLLCQKILPSAAAYAGFSTCLSQCREIGFNRIDLADIHLGNGKDPSISIDSLRIDYSPRKLIKRRRIEKIVVSGMKLHLDARDGTLKLENWSPETLRRNLSEKQQTATNEDQDQQEGFPIDIHSLEIKNALLIVKGPRKLYRIPFSLAVLPRGDDMHYFQLDILPWEHRMTMQGYFVPVNGELKVSLDGQFELSKLADVAGTFMPGDARMRGDLAIEAEAQLRAWRLASLDLNGQLSKLDFRCPGAQLENANGLGKEKTIFISAKYPDQNGDYDLYASNLRVTRPVSANLTDFRGKLSLAPGSVRSNGSLRAAPLDDFLGNPDWRMSTVPAKISYSIQIDSSGRNASCQVAHDGAFSLSGKGLDFTADKLSANIEENTRSGESRANFNLDIQRPAVKGHGLRLDGASAEISGDFNVDSANPPVVSAKFRQRDSTARAKGDPWGQAEVSSMDLEADLKMNLPSHDRPAAATLTLQAQAPRCKAELKTGSISGGAARLKCHATLEFGKEFKLQAEPALNISDISFKQPMLQANFPEFAVDGELDIDHRNILRAELAWRAPMNQASWQTNGGGKGQLATGEFGGPLRVETVPDMPPTLEGTVSGGGDQIQFGDLTAGPYSFNLPWSWNKRGQAPPGQFQIARGAWGGLTVETIAGALRQKDIGIDFTLEKKGLLYPDLQLRVEGHCSQNPRLGPRTNLSFALEKNGGEPWNLGKINPNLDNYVFDAKNFGVKGEFSFGDGTSNSKLLAVTRDGSLQQKDMDMEANDIELRFELKDLFKVESDGGQNLSVKSFRFGKLDLNDLQLDCRIGQSLVSDANPDDDPRRSMEKCLFLENGSFNWCGGKVSAQSSRINLAKKDFDIFLQCRDLKFTDVVKEFYNLDLVGDGRLSGVVPLRWRNGKLTIEDGYLHSTPGEKGNFRIQDQNSVVMQALAQTKVPPAALRDFRYDWSKISIRQDGQTGLRIKLEIFGRPAEPYRVGKQLVNLPILLELRINTPNLNEAIEYGFGLKAMFNGLKNIIPGNIK